MTHFQISAEAQNDLFEIWQRIADDSVDLANRIESEFYALFELLAQMPHMGRVRSDLTRLPVRFFPLYSFFVVYQTGVGPMRIVAVLRGRRDVNRILKNRL